VKPNAAPTPSKESAFRREIISASISWFTPVSLSLTIGLGLNSCLVAIEAQAIEVDATLRLKRLLHRLAAIAALLLLYSLRPDWRGRDYQQGDGKDEPSTRMLSLLRDVIIVLLSELAIVDAQMY
jgi:hypothetical protein